MQDLAPRDIVARALTAEYQAGHQIFLDLREVQDFETHSPQITQLIDRHQIPFRQNNLIPVRPGAHFMMGGLLRIKLVLLACQDCMQSERPLVPEFMARIA